MSEKSVTAVARPLREQYEKGLAALQRQNLDYAVAIFAQVLQKEPGFYACREALRATQVKKTGGKSGFLKRMFGTASSSPLFAKGQLALRTNPVEAINIAEQLLNSDPNNSAAHKLLADAALAADLPRTAALSLEIAFKIAPDREVALKLGRALASAGMSDKAERILSELASTFPNDPEIAKVLKNVSAKRTLSEGGYEALGVAAAWRAVRRSGHALARLAPNAPDSAERAGRIRAEREAYELGECWQRVEKYPCYLRIRFDLGEFYFKAGKSSGAISEFQT